ncbi:hypothetical protein BpHYR1_050532 [Brachionus plicatilis]|uniref:Uncharacterized protein n=1 Tax=Brachionus plicatilis TaxID=10195 RepID=A0A3M7P2L8_BRAPC|nr:hypothetical protein BpHYR1_050532 [Brachionus plicatilis]
MDIKFLKTMCPVSMCRKNHKQFIYLASESLFNLLTIYIKEKLDLDFITLTFDKLCINMTVFKIFFDHFF